MVNYSGASDFISNESKFTMTFSFFLPINLYKHRDDSFNFLFGSVNELSIVNFPLEFFMFSEMNSPQTKINDKIFIANALKILYSIFRRYIRLIKNTLAIIKNDYS